jgi:segregation and condensation protein B
MDADLEKLQLSVEALLFAAGHPLSVKEITEALKVPDFRAVQHALRSLGRSYHNRRTAVELSRVGERYTLQVRDEYLEAARPVTPTELAPRTLKALTLVAYHQPIRQSQLVRMLGDGAYEEVQRLRTLTLLHCEPKGATLELTTTRAFVEQFGLPSSKPEEIRKLLEQRLGVAPAPAPPTEPEAPAPTSGDPAPNVAPSLETRPAA